MKAQQSIAVLGGNGKAGKFLTRQLIGRNFLAKLLIRHPADFAPVIPSGIEMINGNAGDPQAVRMLVKECHAVVSTLGQPKGEPPIFYSATKNVLQAMREWNVRRYILIAGLNIDVPGDEKGMHTQAATDWMNANYPDTSADRQREFDILSDSDVDWTLVRLPWIELTEVRSKVLVSTKDCPGKTINAGDLANFLIDQAEDTTFLRRAPFIASVSI